MSNQKIKHLYLKTKLLEWADLFKIDQEFFSNFIFRGQKNEGDELSTSLERHINKLYPDLVDTSIFSSEEKEMIKEFQWKYPLYESTIIDKDDYIEWLAIMQHYGAPTRLLDFSNSIFVAIYFAIINNTKNGVIWAINRNPINSKIVNKYRKENKTNQVSQEILDKYTLLYANKSIKQSVPKSEVEKQLFIVKPKRCNERLAKQQGIFLMPSTIQHPFSECLYPYLNSKEIIEIQFSDLIKYRSDKYGQEEISVIHITIPSSLNIEIAKNLRAMNVTTEILFPGLSGLAKSLKYKRFTKIG